MNASTVKLTISLCVLISLCLSLTLLHACDEAVILGQGGRRMIDPVWDPQPLSDHRVSEQSDLTQGEAVGGQPVCKHCLKLV